MMLIGLRKSDIKENVTLRNLRYSRCRRSMPAYSNIPYSITFVFDQERYLSEYGIGQ